MRALMTRKSCAVEMRNAILGNRLKIHIPPDAMCSGNFGRFHRRKFKLFANKDIKGKNTHLFGIYNSRLKPTFYRHGRKTLFNHCLLHLLRPRDSKYQEFIFKTKKKRISSYFVRRNLLMNCCRKYD